jgi:trafficking protein particle complex subunit 9
MQSMLDVDIQAQTFQWSKENLMAQLPIKPGSSASFTLYIHATADFLAPGTDGTPSY